MVLVASIVGQAQWTVQSSNTTADLRGIYSVGNGVAWASGTNGTVLRTEDGGFEWQTCAVPQGAEKLDFRGVQGFDANTAIVMSSGKGDLSRLYKTTDGCHSWKLVFRNPDPEGFWDALGFVHEPAIGTKPAHWSGMVVGDPVGGKFAEFASKDNGDHWTRYSEQFGAPAAREGEALFAASNSSMLLDGIGRVMLVTGGTPGARSIVLSEYVKHGVKESWKFVGESIPLAPGESAGAFAVSRVLDPVSAANLDPTDPWRLLWIEKGVCVAVGGDYRKPDASEGTAAFSNDSGLHWTAADVPPHGYRSSAAWDPDRKLWIAVGPNGTDVSADGGRTWRAVKASAALHEQADADRNWNAISLPFVVGPHGRIGKLDGAALSQAK